MSKSQLTLCATTIMRIISVLALIGLTACTGEGDPAPEELSCTEGKALERIEVDGLDGDERVVAVEIRANDGCAPLDGPLAAMNWFSISDPEALAAYNDVAGPLALASGARVLLNAQIVEPVDVPAGSTPHGGPWVHDQLSVPLYTSARAFLEMMTSEAFQAAPPKDDGVAPHYEFGFQECLVNCDIDGPKLPIAVKGPLLLQHVAAERTAVQDAVEQLDGIVYAGYRMAHLVFVTADGGSSAVPWQDEPWADATIVYQVADRAAADALITSGAFQDFAAQTSQQALLLLDTPGIPSYLNAANTISASYGRSSLIGSGLFNSLALLLIPVGWVVLLRRLSKN